MIHYHGTPITPRWQLVENMQGRCFCVRFGEHRDIGVAHTLGQSVMLDNGAFSRWTKGTAVDWTGYYEWCEPWLDYHTTWAVIPDVIDGSEGENDELVAQWPHDQKGAPVWHMHESFARLDRLCSSWSRVCIGSSGQYANPQNDAWRRRMEETMNALCGNGPAPVWLHMLRAMSQAAGGPYPFASTDSTNLARNHKGSHKQRPQNLRAMAERIDGRQAPARWTVVKPTEQLQFA